MVVEGVNTATAAYEMAHKYNVEMPMLKKLIIFCTMAEMQEKRYYAYDAGEKRRKMNVIVVGGGKVGRKLVEDFNYEGDDVVLIDIKSEICDRIQDDYDVRCVCGSGTDLEALREAEANKADIFIAVTENDEFNALCTVMAKKLGAADVLQE